MFKIDNVVCDDKKLADVLRALAGLVLQTPQPVPVVGAMVKNGKVQSAGDVVTLFAAELKKRKAVEIAALDMREFLRSIGRPVNSYSYFVTQAQKLGLLKRKPRTKGPDTRYLVNPEYGSSK
jgi:hypothetical protein